MEIDKLFRAVVKLEGSDLHLKVGSPPFVRVRGSLRPLNRGPIDAEEMARLVLPMFQPRRPAAADLRGERRRATSPTALQIDDKRWRFRVNVLQQMGSLGLVARRVNNWIPDFKLAVPARRRWRGSASSARG